MNPANNKKSKLEITIRILAMLQILLFIAGFTSIDNYNPKGNFSDMFDDGEIPFALSGTFGLWCGICIAVHFIRSRRQKSLTNFITTVSIILSILFSLGLVPAMAYMSSERESIDSAIDAEHDCSKPGTGLRVCSYDINR